ncbi:hypothetical protein L916_08602, partial [Phytophthora nicotianae]
VCTFGTPKEFCLARFTWVRRPTISLSLRARCLCLPTPRPGWLRVSTLWDARFARTLG